ncbi:hypothetical protein PYW08_016434 [Mythimna loreyi]|uniref:Uncharacterized protein n=1 Tax=Mythimna loreyi TaxID=667449 RepID=A0ACC2QXM1_9NEOP|nr:hypothetical protein PYW08_016434 [Mythimna loreyi]
MFLYFRAPTSAGRMGWGVTIISMYCNSMADIRYIFQYFVMQSILFVVSEQLKAITRSIDSELSSIKEKQENVEHAENLSRVTVNYDKINKWEKAYQNINYSSILCNSMFSMQSTATTTTTTTTATQLVYMCLMVVFLSALLLISRAGQQVQNSYEELRQKLCELCVHSLEHEKYYKLTKDLLRYMRTRPVRVHVFGTLDVNMSLLPSVVAFFTTYTVIALQFNNVL